MLEGTPSNTKKEAPSFLSRDCKAKICKDSRNHGESAGVLLSQVGTSLEMEESRWSPCWEMLSRAVLKDGPTEDLPREELVA